MKKKAGLPGMFRDFFLFGCFTFGGGWSIVAQMQKLYVEEKKTLTAQELLDLTSVGRSMPGTMIGNIAMLYGYRMAGYIGGATALFAMILPPFLVLSVVAGFYQAFRENVWVAAAMMGVRAAVVPIIAAAAWKMVRGAFQVPPCYLVALLCAVLYVFLNISGVYLVIVGGIAGWLITALYQEKLEPAKEKQKSEEKPEV